MNTGLLWEIVQETTSEFRKGDVVRTEQLPGVDVVTVDLMPPRDELPSELERVDMHFIEVGVDRALAESRRDDLLTLLQDWPDPERLAAGPSYIEAGGVVGDQGIALRLFALGQVLGLWSVITPERLGLSGEIADRAAGVGYVMVTGFSCSDESSQTSDRARQTT